MGNWRVWTSAAVRFLSFAIEESAGRLKQHVKRRFGWLGPIEILPYRGYGSESGLHLIGRVLEAKVFARPRHEDSRWQNFRAMARRFLSEEIPGARVRARLGTQELETITDDEGYFRLRFQWRPELVGSQPWREVELELLDEIVAGQGPVHATGQIFVPTPATSFGVISDIDDTILETFATDFWKTAKITMLNNARTRLPLPGVSAFYQALQRGPTQTMENPLFYVSSSAWNLYDVLIDFLELNQIPAGPLLLQDLGLTKNKFIHAGHTHKLVRIAEILDTYPKMPFVLLGDSGQQDPWLYRDALRDFPGRIPVIYIRDVTLTQHHERVAPVAREVAELGAEMILIEDTVQAAEDAARRGLISEESLTSVRQEQARDLNQRRPLSEIPVAEGSS